MCRGKIIGLDSKMSRNHTHYYYTFGAATSRRVTETCSSVSCQSTKEFDHIGAGKNYCIFATKPDITYAASKPSMYPIPTIIKVDGVQLTSEVVINKQELSVTFDFEIGISSEEPQVKRRRVQLENEVSKNEITYAILKEMLISKRILVNQGSLDETPSLYSPFYRSKADLYMYHEHFYKKQVINSAIANGAPLTEDCEDDVEMHTTASVCEMKSVKKTINQLIANMIHFGVQITVKALKEGEIIDCCVVYGLGVRYNDKAARFLKVTMDFNSCNTTVEDFGSFELVDAFNDVISKIAKD